MSLAFSILIVLGIVIVMALVYHYKTSARETVVFLGSSFGVAAALIGVIFTGSQLRNSAEQQRQQVILRRQEVAFKYMEKFQALPEKAALRLSIDSLHGKSPGEIQAFFRDQQEAATRVHNMLGFFEELAVAVRSNYADEAILCAFLEKRAVRYYGTVKAWVTKYRQADSDPTYLEHYQWLYHRWGNGCPPLKPGKE